MDSTSSPSTSTRSPRFPVTEAVPVSWTEGPTASAVYEFLYEFLDFENEKRLIVYGLILIVMMIVRPQGIITRESLRRFQFMQRRSGHV